MAPQPPDISRGATPVRLVPPGNELTLEAPDTSVADEKDEKEKQEEEEEEE